MLIIMCSCFSFFWSIVSAHLRKKLAWQHHFIMRGPSHFLLKCLTLYKDRKVSYHVFVLGVSILPVSVFLSYMFFYICWWCGICYFSLYFYLSFCPGHRGCDCMVVGFITTCTISSYHRGWVWIPLKQGVFNTILCDKSLSVTCCRSVVFFGYSDYLHQ